jgi:hypothetical protein
VVDDAVSSHAAAETLVNNLRNTIAQLPLATRSSDGQPATTADRAALDTNLDLAQRASSATKTQLDGSQALLSILIDASTYSAPPVPDGTSAPSSTASTAAATVPAASATLAFELARAEANTLAKQSTETWPQVNVQTVLEYDMNNHGQWRRWFHNQAALHDCVMALTYDRPRLHLLAAKSGAIRSEPDADTRRLCRRDPVCTSRATVTLWSSRSTICGAVPRLPVRQLMPFLCRPACDARTRSGKRSTTPNTLQQIAEPRCVVFIYDPVVPPC